MHCTKSASARSISCHTATCWCPKFGHPWSYRLEWYTTGTVVYFWIFDSQVTCTYLKLLLSYTCLFTTTPQEGGLIVALLVTPLMADLVDKYIKMSRKKHPFNLLYKLHNRLWHVCEITTETAKHGRNRQPHNSLNSISWLCRWGCRVVNDFRG